MSNRRNRYTRPDTIRTPTLRRSTRFTLPVPEGHPLYHVARHFYDPDLGESLAARLGKVLDGVTLRSLCGAEDRRRIQGALADVWQYARAAGRQYGPALEANAYVAEYRAVCAAWRKRWIDEFTLFFESHGARPLSVVCGPSDSDWRAADGFLQTALSHVADVREREGLAEEAAFTRALGSALGRDAGALFTKRWLVGANQLCEFRFVVRAFEGVEHEPAFGMPINTPLDFSVHPELQGQRGFLLKDFAVPMPFAGTGFSSVLRFVEQCMARSMERTLLILEYVHADMLGITLAMGAAGYHSWLQLDQQPQVLKRDGRFDHLLRELAQQEGTPLESRWLHAYNPTYGADPVYNLTPHLYWLSPYGQVLVRARMDVLTSRVLPTKDRPQGRIPKSHLAGAMKHFVERYHQLHRKARATPPGATNDSDWTITCRLMEHANWDCAVNVWLKFHDAPATPRDMRMVFYLYTAPTCGGGFPAETTRELQVALVTEILSFVAADLVYDRAGVPENIVLRFPFDKGSSRQCDPQDLIGAFVTSPEFRMPLGHEHCIYGFVEKAWTVGMSIPYCGRRLRRD